MYEYVGNIHIHSAYSDGSGTVEEIACEAQKAHLDFIIITDHETLKGYLEKKEGWYGNTLVMFGTELNKDDHHYLAFNLKDEIKSDGLNPQQIIDLVNQKGGFGFIAHPFEKGSPFVLKGKHYPWTDWSVSGFKGIEIWNYTSQCRDGVTDCLKFIYTLLFYRNSIVDRPSPEALEKWDKLLTRYQRVLAVGGTDAHAVRVKIGPLKAVVFPYEYLFRTINTHLILNRHFSGEKKLDRQFVYKALSSGHYFTANDKIYSSRGFSFTAENDEEHVLQGDAISINKKTALKVTSPAVRSLIRVIKDGKVVSELPSNNLIFKVLERGAFRVEVYYRSLLGITRPWIYSNPIFVY